MKNTHEEYILYRTSSIQRIADYIGCIGDMYIMYACIQIQLLNITIPSNLCESICGSTDTSIVCGSFPGPVFAGKQPRQMTKAVSG